MVIPSVLSSLGCHSIFGKCRATFGHKLQHLLASPHNSREPSVFREVAMKSRLHSKLHKCRKVHRSSQIERFSGHSLTSLLSLRSAFGLLYVAVLVGPFVCCETICADPPEEHSLAAADLAIRRGDSKKAVQILNAVIASNAPKPVAYYLRGRENFRLGQIKQSMDDFDKYVELEPGRKSRMWERGITCYYAGKYEAGAKQFQLYQTYHSEDVENAAWHFLCLARSSGVEQATRSLLTIRRDGRIPMMTVYDLFAGKANPKDVMAAAAQGSRGRARSSKLLRTTLPGTLLRSHRRRRQCAHVHRIGREESESGRLHG